MSSGQQPPMVTFLSLALHAFMLPSPPPCPFVLHQQRPLVFPEHMLLLPIADPLHCFLLPECPLPLTCLRTHPECPRISSALESEPSLSPGCALQSFSIACTICLSIFITGYKLFRARPGRLLSTRPLSGLEYMLGPCFFK